MRMNWQVFWLLHMFQAMEICFKWAGQIDLPWSLVFFPAVFAWLYLMFETLVRVILDESLGSVIAPGDKTTRRGT